LYVAEREKGIKHGESPVEPISSCRDEHGFVPTVGRWGSEWPSWLETAEIWCQPQGQARGPWIRGVPLPLPVWAHYESPALTVSTVEQYEELAGSVELETQRLLREHRYDTIGNFLRYVIGFSVLLLFFDVLCNNKLQCQLYRFYKDYTTSGESALDRFYRKYQPLITHEHHTCVGLGFELLHRLTGLNKRFPGIASGLYLVSCEEVSSKYFFSLMSLFQTTITYIVMHMTFNSSFQNNFL